MSNGINCFKCKHFWYDYYPDVPVIRQSGCGKGHEKTCRNTPFDEVFTCVDYEHSYLTSHYWGYWFWLGVSLIMIIACIVSFLKTHGGL